MNAAREQELFRKLFPPTGPGIGSVLVVVAHPDDEVIGAGAWLKNREQISFVHVTDGAPHNMKDARENGFKTRQDYARARRKEFRAALNLLNIAPCRECVLPFTDQEASLHLCELASMLQALMVELSPEVVLTLPYEGGHPDHDATAWGVATARDRVREENGACPLVVEMTSYHNGTYGMLAGEFLPDDSATPIYHYLTPEQCAFKRRLYGCYGTQQRTLRWFPIEVEAFRIAPRYDFSRSPHEGKLFYEQYKWGMTSARWCALASQASNNLQPALIR